MKRRKNLLIYVILLLVVLAGCKQENNQSNIKPKDKAPESLTLLSTGIDELLTIVADIEKLSLNIPLVEKEENKAKERESPEGDQQSQEGEQSSQGGESDNSESSNGGSGNGGSGNGGGSNQAGQSSAQQAGGTQEEKDKPLTPDKRKEEIDKKWNEAETKIEEIHPHWNSFEAEGQKKGLTRETAEAFEESFNKMTKSLESKNIAEIYNNSSQSFLRLKPIYDLYTEDFGGDVSAIKYAAYQAYCRTVLGDFEGASRILSERDENINQIRLKVEDDKKEMVDKVNLSLMDFKESLVEKSRRLFMIKKDIIIKNLKELEK